MPHSERTRPQKEAETEAVNLRTSLLEGRWPLSRETFEYHWANLNSFGLEAGQPPQDSVDFAILVSGLFNRWQNARSQGSNSSSRQLQPDQSLLLWNATSDRISALLAPPDWLASGIKLPANSRRHPLEPALAERRQGGRLHSNALAG
jgi:hypothetical protein